MARQPVGVGIIGLGNRGRYFAREWARDPDCRVVACCDRDAEVLRRARGAIGDESVTYSTNMLELLGDPRVRAVIVATHDRHHAECGLAVLEAGRHLFLEKPMAQTIADCDALIEAWERTSVVFMVGLELRYCSLCAAMREILDRGEIGEVRVGHAVDNVSVGGDYYFHGPRRRREYTVSLGLEKGTHTLDLMNWFVGSDPDRVYAEAGLDVFGGDAPNELRCPACDRRQDCAYAVLEGGIAADYGAAKIREDGCVYAREIDVEDNSVTTVRYANGARITYLECHFTPDYNRHFVLIGTRGRMVAFYNNEQQFSIELTYRHSSRCDVLHPPRVEGGHGGGDPMIRREFLSLAQRGQKACPGVMSARNAAAIAIAAARAAATSEVQTIPPYPRKPQIQYPP